MSEKVKLGDVCKVQGGYAFKSKQFQKNKIPIVRIGNIQDNQVEIDYSVCYTEEFLNMHPEFEIQDGDILIAMSGATVGKIGKYKNDKKALLNQRVGNFITTEKLEKGYLYFLLQSPLFEKYILNNAFGCAQPNISSKKIEEFEFYLYDNKEQMEITNQLDKIQKIVDIRKKQIEQLDELIKSQFVEMFENVEETVRLGDCCNVHARIGWQALTKSEHMQNGDYMLITGTDFRNNEIDYSTCVYVSKERYEMDKNIILKNDDILITKDGTIGKVAIVHNLIKPATLNGGVFVVRPKEMFNKEYIAYVFKGPLFTDFVNKSKTGATIKHLNQKHLVEFEIPIPTLEEQIRFSNIYKQVDKQKTEIQKSLEEMKKLQESLMNKYFGE